MGFFLTNSFGMISGQVLILANLIAFERNPRFYLGWRTGYYLDWFAQLWPALLYMLTKKNEDCFGRFNRLDPQTYSIVQYSQAEIFEATVGDAQTEKKRRFRFTAILIDLDESHRGTYAGSFKRASEGACGSFRSSLRLHNCPHGKTRNCEECEKRIESVLTEQIVRDQDPHVESYDSVYPGDTPSGSDLKGSSLNEDITLTGSGLDKSTIEKTGAGATHRDGSCVVAPRHTSFVNDERRASVLTTGFRQRPDF